MTTSGVVDYLLIWSNTKMAEIDLVHLISTDSIHLVFSRYLKCATLRALLQTSHPICDALMQSPYTWQVLDATEISCTGLLEMLWYAKDFMHCIRCVSLDWMQPETMAAAIEEIEDLPNLEVISLVGIGSSPPHFVEAPGKLSWQPILQVLLSARHKGRLKSLQRVALLGGPSFLPGYSSLVADQVIELLEEYNIKTDINFCQQGAGDPMHAHTNLCERDARACTNCGKGTRACTPCLNKFKCRGCNKDWCQNCTDKLDIACYDCGPKCEACSCETICTCNLCGSRFCFLHTFANEKSATEGRQRRMCDWCIEGEKSKSRDR